MPVIAPDGAGFREAQDGLREQLGITVTFQIPEIATWPEGTKVNPDTGLPYDATIQPESGGGFTDVDKTVLPIFKQASPLRPQSDTSTQPVGEMSGMDLDVDVSTKDHEDVREATQMIVNGSTFRIDEWKAFSLGAGAGVYRWIAYGKHL